jgi:hypothetical protein
MFMLGHEHVFQHHRARGVQHVVCGNSGAEMRAGMQWGFHITAVTHILIFLLQYDMT